MCPPTMGRLVSRHLSSCGESTMPHTMGRLAPACPRGYAWAAMAGRSSTGASAGRAPGDETRAGEGEKGAAILRDLVLRFARDPDWVRELATELAAAGQAELPELAADGELREATYATGESVARLFVGMIRGGLSPEEAELPPGAVELTRELVHRGVSVEALLRAYHAAHAAFFRRWTEEVRGAVEDPATVSEGVVEGARWSFTFVQALSRGVVQCYQEERERWVRSAAAVRAEVVEAVLGGEQLDVNSAGARLGYDLRRHHLAFVVWSADQGGDGDPGGLERSASAIAASLGSPSPLLVPLGRRLLAGWVGSRQPIDAGSLERLRLPSDTAPNALAAVGSPAQGVDGFRRSHLQAMRARRVARLSRQRPGTVVRYPTVAVAALASADLEHAQEFVATELGPLASDDDDAVRLAATLRVYLEEGASPRRTARRLGVHENTIANRIRSAEELLGRPIKPRISELLVALRLAPLTRERDS